MKRVVFVGGTSHSASTMLDLMLSTHPSAYSIGEVSSLFYPERAHHIDPICGCGRIDCLEWRGVRDRGRENLYQSIFDRHPEIQVIVDSSKNPLWIKEQSERLKNSDIQALNLLIWKTPHEFAFSLSKRGREASWKHSWASYHTKYLSFVKEFRSVRTAALLENPELVLASVCACVGLQPVFSQELYWNKVHHTLFGSAASRIHLHEPGSEEFKRLEKYIVRKESKGQQQSFDMKKYRTIYKTREGGEPLSANVLAEIESDIQITRLVKHLNKRDVSGLDLADTGDLPFSTKPGLVWYGIGLLKRFVRRFFKERMETYR